MNKYWKTLLKDNDPDTIEKVIRVVEAAIKIRYEWNIGMSEPTTESLAELLQATRNVQDIKYDCESKETTND